jgi:hypothetical protein
MGTLTAERSVEIEWQDSMISIEVLERDGQDRPTLCEIKSDAKVRQVTNRMRFAHHPPDRMTWEQEKGDLKWLVGSWQLEDLGQNRTRATYSLEGDPGRMLGLLLRGPIEGKVKEFLTKDSVEGLKRAAESG